ncbi:fatty acid desaturase family protein [Bradyrhizobium vignae]|uniref:Putative Fatty acid desaturase n=1 Tax=Bradyrhizobium vignae TaxID=1549949 RepID=A0A2U3PUW5_9BRAD|nr:fatty acid desaturase [Bradyrhizobium vignae]SPP92950.1 putative Fatty acid desaturase [Bradyrhizobium vignae]
MSSNASAKYPVRVPTEKQAELYRLTNPPKVAWPTVAVLVYVVFGVIAVDVAAIRGLIPLWVGTLLNVATMYPFFHVMHDSMHRAASSNVKLNDWIGRIVLVATGSLGTLETIRYSHMMHHRFTNDPQDPDHYFHGSWWTLPFRWMTPDLRYSWYNLRSSDPRAQKVMKDSLPYTIAVLSIFAGIFYLGYGWEWFMLFLLPQRLMLGLMSFVFLWLPHLDGDEKGELSHIKPAASTSHNLTAGTTIRLGFEKLLAPLMQWHNYHLIHHLWPTTPSYNHAKVWKLMEPELRERDLRIQHDFDLIPTLHVGGTTAVGAQ